MNLKIIIPLHSSVKNIFLLSFSHRIIGESVFGESVTYNSGKCFKDEQLTYYDVVRSQYVIVEYLNASVSAIILSNFLQHMVGLCIRYKLYNTFLVVGHLA